MLVLGWGAHFWHLSYRLHAALGDVARFILRMSSLIPFIKSEFQRIRESILERSRNKPIFHIYSCLNKKCLLIEPEKNYGKQAVSDVIETIKNEHGIDRILTSREDHLQELYARPCDLIESAVICAFSGNGDAQRQKENHCLRQREVADSVVSS